VLPSNVSGVIYKRFEKKIDEVFYELLRELKAAGYKV